MLVLELGLCGCICSTCSSHHSLLHRQHTQIAKYNVLGHDFVTFAISWVRCQINTTASLTMKC